MPSCARYQIFDSYAHVDNQEEAGDLDAWVTHLVRELVPPRCGLVALLLASNE